MSSFILKIIALISMFIDHSGYVIVGKFSSFNYIGRLAFPIFAFQISEGYIHTKNVKKYLLRLLIFAMISQLPFALFRSLISNTFSLNIFFTLLLGLICIICCDKLKNKLVSVLICTLLAIVAQLSCMDYGAYGVIIIVLFYMFKNNKILACSSFVCVTLIKYLVNLYQYGLNYSNILTNLFCFTILPIMFIILYNGKKGKDIKYLLYIFYPVHLLLLYLTSLLVA